MYGGEAKKNDERRGSFWRGSYGVGGADLSSARGVGAGFDRSMAGDYWRGFSVGYGAGASRAARRRGCSDDTRCRRIGRGGDALRAGDYCEDQRAGGQAGGGADSRPSRADRQKKWIKSRFLPQYIDVGYSNSPVRGGVKFSAKG